MNTMMWENPLTEQHLSQLRKLPYIRVQDPILKTLVCGDTGAGAMEDVTVIARETVSLLRMGKQS